MQTYSCYITKAKSLPYRIQQNPIHLATASLLYTYYTVYCDHGPCLAISYIWLLTYQHMDGFSYIHMQYLRIIPYTSLMCNFTLFINTIYCMSGTFGGDF